MTSVPWLCSLLRVLLELFLPWVSSCDRVYCTSLSAFPSLYLFYYNADILVAMVTNGNVTLFYESWLGFSALPRLRCLSASCGEFNLRDKTSKSARNLLSDAAKDRKRSVRTLRFKAAAPRGRAGDLGELVEVALGHCGLQWGRREPFLVMQLQEAPPSYLMCVMLPGVAEAFQLSVQ